MLEGCDIEAIANTPSKGYFNDKSTNGVASRAVKGKEEAP
jgi:hypothetical protein